MAPDLRAASLDLITPMADRCFCCLQISEEWSKGVFGVIQTDEDIHTANERRLKVWLLQPLLPDPLPDIKGLSLCPSVKSLYSCWHSIPWGTAKGLQAPFLGCTSTEPKAALPQHTSHGYSQDPGAESLPGREMCSCGLSCLEHRDPDRNPALVLRN